MAKETPFDRARDFVEEKIDQTKEVLGDSYSKAREQFDDYVKRVRIFAHPRVADDRPVDPRHRLQQSTRGRRVADVYCLRNPQPRERYLAQFQLD